MKRCTGYFHRGKDAPLEAFGTNPKTGELFKTCKACREHNREIVRKYERTDKFRETRRRYRLSDAGHKKQLNWQRQYANKYYGIYAVYMPLADRFKLGHGGLYNRLCGYRCTDENATITAFTEIKDKKLASKEERKLLRETQPYNPNGNPRRETRLNVGPMREYIRNNFEEIYDEEILNIPNKRALMQSRLNICELRNIYNVSRTIEIVCERAVVVGLSLLVAHHQANYEQNVVRV